MVEISKHLFDQCCSDLSCHYIRHPWGRSCIGSMKYTYKNAFIGSAKFYLIIYLAQTLMRGKKMLKKHEWKRMGEYYIRSTVLGGLISSNSTSIGCLLGWIGGGKLRYYSYCYISSFLNGVFIYLEPPGRRGLVINLFSSLTLEYWLRTLQRSGYIALTKFKQTMMFMIGSALLFYLMRLEGDRKVKTPLFWLFTPERVRRKSDNSGNICPHEGPCLNYLIKGTSTYFAFGLALSIARVLLSKFTSPIKAVSTLRLKDLKTGLFFASYIGIYRAVICYLCRKKGYDSEAHALPAGFLAGLSFLFSPNLGFAMASLTGAFKIYSTILYENKILPENLPLPELWYSFCQATLFHARYMHPDVCPPYLFKLTRACTNGSSDVVYANLMNAVSVTLKAR